MIIVCGLNQAQTQINLHRAKSVIGILGPEMPHPNYEGIEPKNHLKLTFNDINVETVGLQAARESDVEKLVNFISNWDRAKPMVIHCWAGISRSTATAYAAMCLLNPHEDEFRLAEGLRQASPSATPNQLITAKVDAKLGRNGRMISAVQSIGRGANAFEGTPFILDI
jgi:predicted protein tyrosine phosphatase